MRAPGFSSRCARATPASSWMRGWRGMRRGLRCSARVDRERARCWRPWPACDPKFEAASNWTGGGSMGWRRSAVGSVGCPRTPRCFPISRWPSSSLLGPGSEAEARQRSRPPWRPWNWETSSTGDPLSSPAGRRAGWRSPGRSARRRRCCCWTSPWRRSTDRCARGCCRISIAWPASWGCRPCSSATTPSRSQPWRTTSPCSSVDVCSPRGGG